MKDFPRSKIQNGQVYLLIDVITAWKNLPPWLVWKIHEKKISKAARGLYFISQNLSETEFFQ